jgi:glutathione-specific gamma-glutamylcyclotransferase
MMQDSKNSEFWVFGYGSLMWRPGFDFEQCCPALVQGYHRSLCIFSHVHRGTPEKPGLVLGLDRGGICRGLAFRVATAKRDATLAYLREREQVTSVYVETWLTAHLADDQTVTAVAYIVDPSHPQYAGRLPHQELVRLVRQGHGVSGDNVDYIRSTFDHLVAAGIEDPDLAAIIAELA